MHTCVHRYIYTYIHIHIHICMDIYIYTYANICTYTYMYIYMHMHACIYISPQLVHARLCNGTAASLPGKLLRTYLESCANIVQAVVPTHPPAPSSSRPPSCWPVARHVRLRNPIKSTLAHDAIAAVVLHKHHLIIRVGAGLIQFVYGSHSRLAADLTLDKNLFSLPFSRAFLHTCASRYARVGDSKGATREILLVFAMGLHWRLGSLSVIQALYGFKELVLLI